MIIQNSAFKIIVMESMQSKKVAEKQVAATQKFLRVRGIRDGVIELESGGLRAIALASSINFALLSGEEQQAKIFAFQDFLNSLEFPVEIVVQTRALNIAKYLEKVREAERVQENELLRMQIAEYAEYISSLVELSNITTTHFYVVIPYSSAAAASAGSSGIFDKVKSILSPTKKVVGEEVTFEKGQEEMNLRVSAVVGGLSGMGIRSAMLNTQEVVEVLYSWYNPEVSQTEVLGDLEALRIEKG